jgi:hypothetical protein
MKKILETYSNETIDNYIKVNKISVVRIGDFVDRNTAVDLKCTLCGEIKTARIDECLYMAIPCSSCRTWKSKKLITNALLDEYCKDHNLERLESVIDNKTKIKFKCLKDNYIFNDSPYKIIFLNNGCPMCRNRAVITNERVDEYCAKNNIVRLGDVKGARVPIPFKCLIDGYEWKCAPSTMLTKKTGCFKCLYKRQKYVQKVLAVYFKPDEVIEELKILCPGQKFQYKIDFVLPKLNTYIEYNGKQHYEPCTFGRASEESANKKFKDQQYRDDKVREYCKTNNINLIEIPYWTSDSDIESIIKKLKESEI